MEDGSWLNKRRNGNTYKAQNMSKFTWWTDINLTGNV